MLLCVGLGVGVQLGENQGKSNNMSTDWRPNFLLF